MSLSTIDRIDTAGATHWLPSVCVGAAVYWLLLVTGDTLLQDSDTFWQIGIGQWIIDHTALPDADFYSLTRAGQPWRSSAWLSQVLLATAFAHGGWAGVVLLTALAAGTAIAVMVQLLAPYAEPTRRILVGMLALMLSWHHLLARPHVLALPVMVGFAGGLIVSVDRRVSPPWFLLPLLALWANLHGGFILGLAVIAPVGLEAVWRADSGRRARVASQWLAFAIAAAAACCCTPYGWHTFAAAAEILNLGAVLFVLSEWRSADFSSFGLFEATLLGIIGLLLFSGVTAPLPRIALLLALTQMALAHVRSIDAFALLMPIALARPLSETWSRRIEPTQQAGPFGLMPALALGAIAMGAVASTGAYTAHHHFEFVRTQTPKAAVDALQDCGAKRVFNADEFGGYLISRGIPTFIDGRAELYGERYMLAYFDAVAARDVDHLIALLGDNDIDATLLPPQTPAAKLLDRLSGWRRLYADDIAVVHVRVAAQPVGHDISGDRM